MRQESIVLAAAVAVVLTPGLVEATCSSRSGKSLVPLVELYTSEGCSSCPPADQWFSKQVSRTEINWLAFHVDYWDNIGWPDRFALAENSQRQRHRVNAGGGDIVYTPQVMVGEQTRVSWSSKSAFDFALRAAQGEARMDLDIELMQRDGIWEMRIGSSMPEGEHANVQVWLARALDGQITKVERGENKGATLRHDNVVRQVWGPWTPPVRQVIAVKNPNDGEGDWRFVAFAQDEHGQTLQSLALRKLACTEASL